MDFFAAVRSDSANLLSERTARILVAPRVRLLVTAFDKREKDEMASKVQVVLIDDIDGGEADATFAFSLEGTDYEIDLSEDNAQTLRQALAPYIEAGRRASGGKSRRRSQAGPGKGRSAKIRSWARDNGIEVNARGRIPADVVAKYDAAQR